MGPGAAAPEAVRVHHWDNLNVQHSMQCFSRVFTSALPFLQPFLQSLVNDVTLFQGDVVDMI